MTAKPARREAPEKLGNCRSWGQGDGLRRLEAVAQAVEGKMNGLGGGVLMETWSWAGSKKTGGWDRVLRK